MKCKIKKCVKHQNIGGKVMTIEKMLTADDIEEEIKRGNIACVNFVMRRDDFDINFNKICFYGYVKKGIVNLGYVVCEDEVTPYFDLSENVYLSIINIFVAFANLAIVILNRLIFNNNFIRIINLIINIILIFNIWLLLKRSD